MDADVAIGLRGAAVSSNADTGYDVDVRRTPVSAGMTADAQVAASSPSSSASLEHGTRSKLHSPAHRRGAYAVTTRMPAVPSKRSRWHVQDDDDGDGGAGDDFERQAKDVRDRAAARAARERVRAPQRQRRNERDGNASSTSPSVTGDAARDKMQRKRTGQAPSRAAHPAIQSCRSIHCYERLNHIEEGSYGVVFRARERATGDIVAIKKLKMDGEQNGFPITSLREIRTIMAGAHPNVVRVREIVVGDTLTQIFIVMDFIEHDLKTLLSSQTMPFLASEIKTLLHQLLSAMSLLHRNWIIHRDLKTSNLLMNNRGQIKVADFGLARMYGESSGKSNMTKLVVTLWYRAPELLLGADSYDTAIDMWSVGCVFAELITREPLFTGKNEVDQISKIFRLLGQPTDDAWPGFSALPHAKQFQHKQVAQPYSMIAQKVGWCTEQCLDLLYRLLTYDPRQRITADEALQHAYFTESPAPAHPDTFSTFPSIAAGEKRRSLAASSPAAPQRLADQKLAYQLEMDV